MVVVVQAILDHQQLAASVGRESAEFAVSLSRMSQDSTFGNEKHRRTQASLLPDLPCMLHLTCFSKADWVIVYASRFFLKDCTKEQTEGLG